MSQSHLEAINNAIRYTNLTAFRLDRHIDDPAQATDSVAAWIATLEGMGVTFRGAYDVRAFNADASLLVWLHAEHADMIQAALREFGRSHFGAHFTSVCSGMGVHRPAEFNRSHVPGFLLGHEAKEWICTYPFVRSYEWYLLPEAERREMLAEHGLAGREYPGIVSSTVAAFALGDYEWILALESDELHDLVDMMRDLRYTKARLHVRDETPFFTGKRITLPEIGAQFS